MFDPDWLRQEPASRAPEIPGFMPLKQPATWAGWSVPGEIEPDDVVDVDAEQDSDRAWNGTTLPYANQMLQCLVWDPALSSLPRFTVCSVPLGYETNQWQMLRLIGTILDQCDTIRCVTFDNATPHNLVKRMMLGRPLPQDKIKDMPFWSKLTFKAFPESPLPRFPFSRPMLGDQALFHGLRLGCLR